MDPRVAALAEILRLNTKLFRNCLDGLTDAAARERPPSGSNNAAFVAAHVADARFFLLRLLGADATSPLAPRLAGAKGIDDVKEWPSLEEIRAAWTQAAHALRERLDSLTAADLDQPVKKGFPVADATVLGALTFLVQHDSYHVGQLSLLRRQAGLPAMSYT